MLYPNGSVVGHLRSVACAKPASVLQNKLLGILQLRLDAAKQLRCLLNALNAHLPNDLVKKCAGKKKSECKDMARSSAVNVNDFLVVSFIPSLFRRDGAQEEEGQCCGKLAIGRRFGKPCSLLGCSSQGAAGTPSPAPRWGAEGSPSSKGHRGARVGSVSCLGSSCSSQSRAPDTVLLSLWL